MKISFGNFILEIAYHEDNAIEKIEDLLPELIEHIIKCKTMPNSIDVEHWLKEIKNWLKRIDRFSYIKTKHKRISFKVFKNEFNCGLKDKDINKFISSVEYDYGELVWIKNRGELIKFVQHFMDTLFKDLADDNYEWKNYERLLK